MILKGIVENNQDDEYRSRVKVRIFGIHSQDTIKIPTTALPWAEVQGSTAFGLIGGVGVSSILQNGTWVYVDFIGGDIECPIVTGTVCGINIEKKDYADLPANDRLNISDIHPDAQKNYGYVQIIETPSGNIIKISDVKGEESIQIMHRSGTNFKMTHDSKLVIETVNKGNLEISVDGDLTTIVKGNSTIKCQKKATIECANVIIKASIMCDILSPKTNIGVGGIPIARLGDTVTTTIEGTCPTGKVTGTGTGTISACSSLNTST